MPQKQSLNKADAETLARDLAGAPGAGMRFNAANRAGYMNDASNYRKGPIAVVVPEALEDVAEIRLLAIRDDAPAAEAP